MVNFKFKYNEKKTALKQSFKRQVFLFVIRYALIASRARQRVDFFLATVFFL